MNMRERFLATLKGGPFMAPEMYRKLVCPKLQRVMDVCDRAGVPFKFVHSSGDVTLLVPLWKETGVNGVMPLDVSGGTDPVKIRADHPDLALIGGIDRTVLSRDKPAIAREVANTAGVLLSKGKSIPSIDVPGVDGKISFDNIQFYAECLRNEAASIPSQHS